MQRPKTYLRRHLRPTSGPLGSSNAAQAALGIIYVTLARFPEAGKIVSELAEDEAREVHSSSIARGAYMRALKLELEGKLEEAAGYMKFAHFSYEKTRGPCHQDTIEAKALLERILKWWPEPQPQQQEKKKKAKGKARMAFRSLVRHPAKGK